LGHDHHHDHSGGRIVLAFWLNFGFAVIELIGGIWTNSMAIISDAIHDFGDSVSLGFAWYMEKVSHKAANQRFTYGYRRFSVLSSIIVSLVLVAGSAIVIKESIERLIHPEPTNAMGMVGLAVFGIAINGFAGWRLSGQNSLNEKVLSWHFWEDLLGWVAVLIGGLVIEWTDWYRLDPILSIGISLFIIFGVIRRLREALNIILQAVPSELAIARIEQKLASSLNATRIHHTHIWTMDGEHHILTSHLVFDRNKTVDEIFQEKTKARELLKAEGIDHATFEVELEP
jgi:cobalt-zinc-cadmium efflux system protein